MTGCWRSDLDTKSSIITGGFTTGGGEGGDLFTGSSGAGDTPVCEGHCARSVSSPFERITLFSIGAPDEVRPCSDLGSSVGFEGHVVAQVAPHTCAACACSPTSCTLPETMHASAAKCAGADSAPSLPFPVERAWEGACSAEGAIPAGLQCDGVPCVQSLTVAAPAITPCKPMALGPAPALPEPASDVLARECLIHVDGSGPGCAVDESCTTAPPEGFRLCLMVAGNHEDLSCPADYDEKLVIAAGSADQRTCTPCTCGDPEGADCSALVSLFTDASCDKLLATVTLEPDEPVCVDLPSGSALGSKDAFFTTDKPGTCPSGGGKPVGQIEAIEPVTLCCQPASGPTP